MHFNFQLLDHIEVISRDTLIISEEFSSWDRSDRRIDLLGVDRHEPNSFDEEDEEVLMAFASHMAAAIRNANLYEAARRQAELDAQLTSLKAQLIKKNRTLADFLKQPDAPRYFGKTKRLHGMKPVKPVGEENEQLDRAEAEVNGFRQELGGCEQAASLLRRCSFSTNTCS